MGVGEVVYCVKQDILKMLVVGNSYLITGSSHGRNSLAFSLDGINRTICFPSDIFVSYDEFRRQKIEKICDSIKVKK